MTLHFFKDELAAFIKKLESFYELSGITLATQTHQNISLITSYPHNWINHYKKQGYDQIDPVHLNGFNTTNDHFLWGKNFTDKPLGDQQLKLFEEAAHHHILSGLSFPLKSPNQPQLVSIAFPYSETITGNLSEALLNELKSHIQILPTVIQVQKIKHAAFLQTDIAALAIKHMDLTQDLHMISHEMNDLFVSLSAYLSYLPTQFRQEGAHILEILQTVISKERDPR